MIGLEHNMLLNVSPKVSPKSCIATLYTPLSDKHIDLIFISYIQYLGLGGRKIFPFSRIFGDPRTDTSTKRKNNLIETFTFHSVFSFVS